MRYLVCFGSWDSWIPYLLLEWNVFLQKIFKILAITQTLPRGYSAYSPSKFALRALADVLHAELRPHGIGVSVLFPPNTATEGFQEEQRTMPEQVTNFLITFSNKEVDLLNTILPNFLTGPPDQQLGWRVQPRAGGLRLCGLPSHRPILDLPGHGGQNAGFVSGSRVAGAKSPEGIGTGKHIEFPLWIWNMVIVEFSCSDLLGRTCSRCNAHLRGPI